MAAPPAKPGPGKPELTPEQKRRLYFLYAGIGLLVFAALFLVPVALAVPCALLSRRFVRRLEAFALAAVGVLYLVLYAQVWIPAYVDWYRAILGVGTGDVSRWAAPWPMFAAVAAVGVGLANVVSKSKILSWGIAAKPDLGQAEQILPSEVERETLTKSGVAAPGVALAAPVARTLTGPTPDVGRRSFPIGFDKVGAPVMIREDEINKHGLLFGSTGSGKSESIKVLAAGLLDLGWSGMILDLKEDAQTGGLMDWCQEYADFHALGFQKFRLSDPDPPAWFNVLYGMGPDEARDTILAAQEFEAAYYRALNELQLGQLITLMYNVHSIDPSRYAAPTVYSIGKLLSSADLPAATREMVALVITSMPQFTRDDFNTLIRPEKAQAEAAFGLGARLTAMYETQVGRTALRPGGNRSAFDVTIPGLSYIGLDSMGKPELTRLVSASVLRRMAVYAADRTSGKLKDKQPRFLIVDEANFVNRRLLLELLSRARSAGLACIVATQGPSDWSARQPGEPDLTSLKQNCNVSIIHGQGERTNAELCADIIGRGEKTVLSQRVSDGQLTDAGSLSTTVDFLVSPDALRGMKVGEAIVRVDRPNEWCSWVKVIQRDPRALPR